MDVQSTFYNVRVMLCRGKRLPVYKDSRDSEPLENLRAYENDILQALLAPNGWMEFREPGKSFWLPLSGNTARYSLEQAWDNEVAEVEILVGGVWKSVERWVDTKQVDL